VIAIKPDGPIYAGATAIAVAIAGYLRQPAHPDNAGGRAGSANQLEPVHRNLAQLRSRT